MTEAWEDELRIAEEQVKLYESSIARLDREDPEEIDPDEYEAILSKLVRARETLEALLKRNSYALSKRPRR